MSEYLFDCHKCTNKLITIDGMSEYCRPMVEGKEACHIISGETGKDFVFGCDQYTTDQTQIGLYEAYKLLTAAVLEE